MFRLAVSFKALSETLIIFLRASAKTALHIFMPSACLQMPDLLSGAWNDLRASDLAIPVDHPRAWKTYTANAWHSPTECTMRLLETPPREISLVRLCVNALFTLHVLMMSCMAVVRFNTTL